MHSPSSLTSSTLSPSLAPSTLLFLAFHYCTYYIIIDYIIPLYPDDMFMIYRCSMQMTFVFAPNTYCDHFCCPLGASDAFSGPHILWSHFPSMHSLITDIWSHIDYMCTWTQYLTCIYKGGLPFFSTLQQVLHKIFYTSHKARPPYKIAVYYYVLFSLVV